MNEDDELALSTIQNDSETSIYQISELEIDCDISMKERDDENNENCNTENVEKIEEMPKKRRKLSPIVYNRSHSPSLASLKHSTLSTSPPLSKRKQHDF